MRTSMCERAGAAFRSARKSTTNEKCKFFNLSGYLAKFSTNFFGSLPHSASPAARLVYVVRAPSAACCSMWRHFSHMAPEDGGFTGSLEQ